MFQIIRPLIRPLRGNFFFLKLLCLISKDYKKIVINPNIKYVIEGSPRSANTFFQTYFETMNPELKGKIGHHTHTPAQIKQTVKLALPTIILIREPLPTICSLVVREKHLKINDAIKDYIQFNSYVLENSSSFIIAEFKLVINKPELVINAFNEKFSLNLKYQELDKNLNEKINKIVIEERKKNKRAIHPDFEKTREEKNRETKEIIAYIDSNEYSKNLLEKANEIYKEIQKTKTYIS